MESKKELRKLISMRKKQVPLEERRHRSVPVMERLMALPRFRKAQNILFYWAMQDEVATQDAVLAFQANNGLAADGIVGKRTWTALTTFPDPLPVLRRHKPLPGAGRFLNGSRSTPVGGGFRNQFRISKRKNERTAMSDQIKHECAVTLLRLRI